MAEETETQEEQAQVINEDDLVRNWRFEELVRAGWSDDAAQVVAACLDIDLHEACDLVRVRGCQPSKAMAILL